MRQAARRWAAGVLTVLALCLVVSPVSAQETAAPPSGEWLVSEDYIRVEIGGRVYENPTMLIKLAPGEYLFLNPWADYLADPRVRASRSPDQQQALVNTVVQATLSSLALQFPDVELIALGNKPWQEHPFGDYYLSLLPAEHRAVAADPSIRGYAAEVIRQEVSASYARRASRDGVEVLVEAYHLYRTPADVKLVGDALAPEAREYVRMPYREFIAHLGAEWPKDWNSSEPPTKQVEVVLYLNQADLTIYENGKKKEARWLDQPAVAPEGRTLIPARAVFEAFGAKVTWLGDTRQVLVETPQKQVLLTIGSNMALVTTKGPNPVAEYVPMQVPAQLLNGRTVVPLRFVAEALGFEVDWYDPERRITVRATVLNE